MGGDLTTIKPVIDTPCFIVKTDYIDSLVKELFTALYTFWPKAIAGYSFKTNNFPWIIDYMKKKGFYAEVVSSDEYNLAREMGFNFRNIIFNGPVKEEKEFIEAVENGAIVNIDSNRELLWLQKCDPGKLSNSVIGLRVNFGLEKYCPNESQCGKEGGRFGFSYENGSLEQAIKYMHERHIPLSGLHLHCSSKTRSLNVYKAIARVADEIVKRYKLKLSYVDAGGGFFGGMPGKPSFLEYFEAIHTIFSSNSLLKNVNLVVEPGISLVGAGVDYVTTVVDTKDTENNHFIILDGSRIHIDPLMHKREYVFEIDRNRQDLVPKHRVKQILCGFTCMESDRFFEICAAPLEIGDKVIFKKVGAYTMGLSPQFIEFYPEVYLQDENQFKVIRNKVTATQFLKIMGGY